jgi:hypothetical protein
MHTHVRGALAAIAAIGAAVGIPLASASTAEAALPPIMISKVQFDSPGADRGGNASLNAEYVVLKNTTRSARSLTGWTLRDKTGYTYRFPTFTLKAGASVTIRTGKGTATQANRYYNKSWYVWNNTGDTAFLRNASGTTVDTCAFKGNRNGYVFC